MFRAFCEYQNQNNQLQGLWKGTIHTQVQFDRSLLVKRTRIQPQHDEKFVYS